MSNDSPGPVVARIQKLPLFGRILVFIGGTALILGVLIGGMIFLGINVATNVPRNVPVAIAEGITTEEYVELPDDEAYPATVAVSADGIVYTGSYVHGAVWAIAPDRSIREIPLSRDEIGSVTAITVAPSGNIYILDRIDPLQALGSKIWRLYPDDTLELVKDYSGANMDTLELPDDLTVDSVGNIYVSDRGSDPDGDHDLIWRIQPDGTEGEWWRSILINNVRVYSPTGVAYNPQTNSIYVSDSQNDVIYNVPILEDGNSGETTTVFNRRQSSDSAPAGFDGMAVGVDGRLYIAALASNRVGVYDSNTGMLTYLAGNYRGAVDVAVDADGRVFVANWDQRSLLPTQVIFVAIETQPHLPFTIDMITP
jgi:DNA-binding beta-propeller fold protein YncE